MREIKYRAWNGTRMNFEIAPINGESYIVFETKRKNAKDLHISRGKIMQYTGLTDKNGVEIYEGDILKTDSTDYFNLSFTAVVKFGEYLQDGSGGEYNGESCLGFYFEAVNPNEVDEYGSRLVPEYMVTCSPLGFNNSEVIGNIYEHPHLLEVSTE